MNKKIVIIIFQALELLTEKVINTAGCPLSLGEALRRLLECVAGGILLPGSPGNLDNLSTLEIVQFKKIKIIIINLFIVNDKKNYFITWN